MHLKRFLPGMLLGLVFIAFFIVGLNSYNPDSSAAGAAPASQAEPVTTGPDVATSQDPATVTQPEPLAAAAADIPDGQSASGSADSAPVESPVTVPQPENPGEVTAADQAAEGQPAVVIQPEQKESGGEKEVSEKNRHFENHEENENDDED